MSAATRHGCADIREDAEGWWAIECDCGAGFGGFPDAITAVDELLDHVLAAPVPLPPRGEQE